MESAESTKTSSSGVPNRRIWWTIGIIIILIGILTGSRLLSYNVTDDVQEDSQQAPKPANKTLPPYLLVLFLAFSAVVALADACRARWSVTMSVDDGTTNPAVLSRQSSMGGVFQKPPLTRRCSLVDLTMSRHERQQNAAHRHQTNSLPETSEPPSLSGTFRSGRKRPPPLSRHCSFSIGGRDIPDGSAGVFAAALRRASVEQLGDAELSPDTRRRHSRRIMRH